LNKAEVTQLSSSSSPLPWVAGVPYGDSDISLPDVYSVKQVGSGCGKQLLLSVSEGGPRFFIGADVDHNLLCRQCAGAAAHTCRHVRLLWQYLQSFDAEELPPALRPCHLKGDSPRAPSGLAQDADAAPPCVSATRRAAPWIPYEELMGAPPPPAAGGGTSVQRALGEWRPVLQVLLWFATVGAILAINRLASA
jgi:hypothetical protein